jgi:hypothetical protein
VQPQTVSASLSERREKNSVSSQQLKATYAKVVRDHNNEGVNMVSDRKRLGTEDTSLSDPTCVNVDVGIQSNPIQPDMSSRLVYRGDEFIPCRSPWGLNPGWNAMSEDFRMPHNVLLPGNVPYMPYQWSGMHQLNHRVMQGQGMPVMGYC